jgi:protein SCO1
MKSTFCLLLLAAAACAAGSPPAVPADLKGPRLTRAFPRPAVVFRDAAGTPFDFRKETSGRLTFLFFGYTNCPDVCPLHMGNLASAIHDLPPEIGRQVQVIFVTTDPARDTPDRLKNWLAQFDSGFVGLSGDSIGVETAQRLLAMPVAGRDGMLPDSSGYAISHGAHLWAFTPDDSAHVVYPLGIQRNDLASDIPKLLKLWPKK